mmetsp:Transcript_28355/g.59219  ORF Transcript_28355/g.59219 Transcript_28355/m.59219 type:complete len:1163 (-) Transcript_28355:45-3533(-)
MIQRPGLVSALRLRFQGLYKQFFELMAAAKSNKNRVVPGSLAGRPSKSKAGAKLQGLRARFSSIHALRSATTTTLLGESVLAGVSNFHCRELVTASTAQLKSGLSSINLGEEEDVDEDDDGENDSALMCLHRQNPLRRFCRWLQGNIVFVTIIHGTVIGSCLVVMSTPQAPDIPGQNALFSVVVRESCDLVFTCIFTIEMIVNIVSQGFISHKHAYLRSGWNIVDFIILLLSWMDLSRLLAGSQGKVFRLARALRPLRLIKRNKGLRILSEALVCTLLPVSYVMGFGCVITVIFAMIGKGVFGGLMNRCSYGVSYPEGKLECSGFFVDQSQGIVYPRSWYNPEYHFDSFYQSTLTLVRVLTLKYVDIMRDAMDVTSQDVSPKHEFSRWNCLFFVSYIVIGPIVTMNLFVAFICDGFNLYRETSEIDVYYNKINRQIEHTSPQKVWFKVPTNGFSKAARVITGTANFQTFSMICVAINIGFMLADHADSSDAFNQMMDQQNFFFFIELCFEVLMNFVGHGFGGFLDDRWKGFDLLIMCGTTIGYLSTTKEFLIFSKAFRLFRVIRLMRMVKAIRIILETLISILPEVGNILLLLCLFYSMFATLFVQVFGITKYGGRIGGTANFEYFPDAMYTIYQMVIGDEWMTIMDDASIQWPACTERFDSTYLYNYTGKQYSFGDCGSSYSRFYFVTFKMICECILLNLFVGVVLENFGFITDEISDREDPCWRTGPSNRQVKELTDVFEKYSAFTGQVSIQAAVTSLLYHLPVPLGFRVDLNRWEIEEHEQAAQRLIRAELNVILLHSNMQIEQREHEWKWLWALPGVSAMRRQTTRMASRRFVNGVRFQDVAMVLTYWRKPSLIPDSVKVQRKERVEDVIMMYCALLITDFFRAIVARRKSSALTKSLQANVAMRRWMGGNEQCARRTMYYANILQEEIAFASKCRRQVAHVRSPLSATQLLIAIPKEGLSATVCSHNEAVLHKVRLCRHIHGLDMFRSRSASQPVLLRFIDQVNSCRPEFYLDMRPATWKGWQMTESEKDIFWRPVRLSANIYKRPVEWDSFEFTSPGGGSDGPPKSWTILDAQSFVGIVGGSSASFVRLNLGSKSTVDELISTEQREMLLGAVVEVIGYAEVETAAQIEDQAMLDGKLRHNRGPGHGGGGRVSSES